MQQQQEEEDYDFSDFEQENQQQNDKNQFQPQKEAEIQQNEQILQRDGENKLSKVSKQENSSKLGKQNKVKDLKYFNPSKYFKQKENLEYLQKHRDQIKKIKQGGASFDLHSKQNEKILENRINNRFQVQYQKMQKIDQENQKIQENLNKIYTRPIGNSQRQGGGQNESVSNLDKQSEFFGGNFLNKKQVNQQIREQNQKEIQKQNQFIRNRIQQTKSVIDFRAFNKDRIQQEKYLKQLSEYPYALRQDSRSQQNSNLNHFRECVSVQNKQNKVTNGVQKNIKVYSLGLEREKVLAGKAVQINQRKYFLQIKYDLEQVIISIENAQEQKFDMFMSEYDYCFMLKQQFQGQINKLIQNVQFNEEKQKVFIKENKSDIILPRIKSRLLNNNSSVLNSSQQKYGKNFYSNSTLQSPRNQKSQQNQKNKEVVKKFFKRNQEYQEKIREKKKQIEENKLSAQFNSVQKMKNNSNQNKSKGQIKQNLISSKNERIQMGKSNNQVVENEINKKKQEKFLDEKIRSQKNLQQQENQENLKKQENQKQDEDYNLEYEDEDEYEEQFENLEENLGKKIEKNQKEEKNQSSDIQEQKSQILDQDNLKESFQGLKDQFSQQILGNNQEKSQKKFYKEGDLNLDNQSQEQREQIEFENQNQNGLENNNIETKKQEIESGEKIEDQKENDESEEYQFSEEEVEL
ncbi:hypothetical protein PPERSA_02412 [Pseudocohnilembus persalinus]|uniref:Uncharacterized protein n=1 Tax=Pseudocohnilembus persalinus TaxID=266149 RepID=A0A0V0QB60_PSEPJ|nr:hypothetical protein PPERSA_02412 [Pseudocohnilembus persalinus]|eukprot:KRW99300.1 hypothetical protein PPERSA_02412 [Pseudocohnilembus persalinus]